LKSAIEVFATDPGLGSLLIYGRSGTGKTSAASSIWRLMPDVPVFTGCDRLCSPWDGVLCEGCKSRPEKGVVYIPMRCVRATINEDVSDAEGKIIAEKIIQQASRGVVIFDPLNLFDPAIVVRVCVSSKPPVPDGRGRVSVIGVYDTMDEPLPTMFLSFTMGVRIEMRDDLEERIEIIQHTKEYTTNPPPEAELEFKRVLQKITHARTILPSVEVPDGTERIISSVCNRFVSQLKFKMDTSDLRSQFLRVCRAYAATQGKQYVSPGDVSEAARLVFTHRIDALKVSFPD
jgi:Mg-chelatase subunit ChlI